MKPIGAQQNLAEQPAAGLYSKALIVVAAEQDGKGIGRIRMARIPRFRSRNASWCYLIVGRTRKHSFHRWGQFLPRNERLYPPPTCPAPPQGWVHSTAQSPSSGLAASDGVARNRSGSYRLPTPRRLPQRIRVPFPTGESLASRGKLFFRRHSTPSRSPRRPTKGWCGHKMLGRLSEKIAWESTSPETCRNLRIVAAFWLACAGLAPPRPGFARRLPVEEAFRPRPLHAERSFRSRVRIMRSEIHELPR